MAFGKTKTVPQENAQKAVIYARYSSDKQTENSIDAQLRAAHTYCEQKGLSVIGEYIDRAISGTTDNRPEFQRMISDAKKGEFAFVVVYRFDRFARNRYDSAIYKKQLEGSGVRVLSTEESVGTGDEGIILESIYDAMAEAYSRRLSKVVSRGMRETAMKGLSTGGAIPLGYKIEGKKLVIDENEAAIVRSIFDEYVNGCGKKKIADELNRKGYRTKRGSLYSISSLSLVLSNTAYIGKNNYTDIERACPVIVDADVFQKAQAIISKNKRSRGKAPAKVDYALAGKLFCGNCGALMIGDCGTSKTKERYYYYSCGTKKRSGPCKKKSEKKDYIEWYVCEQTVHHVLNDKRIDMIADQVIDIMEKENGDNELKRLEKELAKIEKEFDRLTDSLLSATSPTIIKKINDKAEQLEGQKQATENEISSLKLRKEAQLTKKEIVAYLSSFKNGDLMDASYRRTIIKTLVNCVYLFDDKLLVYYNFSGIGPITFSDALDDISAVENDQNVREDNNMVHQRKIISNTCAFVFRKGVFGMIKSRG